MSWGKIALFASGALFGSAGVSILSSKDAKKVYTYCTAAVLRAKDAVVEQATILQENCNDIYEEAKRMNEELEVEAAEETVEDKPEKKKTTSPRGRRTKKA
ncbi:MAG: hypothetical protein IJ075_04670 [Lachnospiraceae bacterium]|nr:hypothetical protein [Lachnospiraceae bacterium]MBQ9607072.1 hypothetical protein [Lachnospiraceae bacterium]MBR1523416.1 hypothetical protein [Lachnospiraceae bacterium]